MPNKTVCFICNKQLQQQWPEGLNTEPHYDPWEDVKEGISFKLNAGYGSDHDGDYGRILICDTCYGARKDNVIDLKNWIQQSMEDIGPDNLEVIDPI
jgi:hypothetical protein